MKHKIIDKGKYILFEISGEYDFTYFKHLFFIIKTKCQKRQVFKAMCDTTRASGIFKTEMERFYIGKEIAKQTGHKIKLAVVGKKSNINYFGETVAVNRGAFFKVFSDYKLAEEWLLE
jgi:hypothetical protein